MGAEDTWKSWKTATDDDVSRLPSSEAETVLSDDMDAKNDCKVETKMKLGQGTCKMVLKQTSAQDKETGNVSHNLADELQLDMKVHGMDFRFKSTPKELSKTLDLGTRKLLDGKLLVNPYVKLDNSRSLDDPKLSLGKVMRYDRFKLNTLLLVNSWLYSYNLQWKHDNLNFAMRHQVNLKEMNFPLYNSKTTYTKNKTSVT